METALSLYSGRGKGLLAGILLSLVALLPAAASACPLCAESRILLADAQSHAHAAAESRAGTLHAGRTEKGGLLVLASGQPSNRNWPPYIDPDVMDVIEARAVINSQIQNTVGQVIIRKPDSVFEYTCFDQVAGKAAHALGPMFSETTAWKNFTYNYGTTRGPLTDTSGFAKPQGSLAGMLESLTLNDLNDYLRANYDHDLLGGTAGISKSFSPVASNGGAACDVMQTVWEIAKGENFAVVMPVGPESGSVFYEYGDMPGFDPRIYPEPSDNPAVTQPMLDLAQNKDQKYASFGQTDTFQDDTLPGKCDMIQPVPEGFIVRKREPVLADGIVTGTQIIEYEAHFCATPGCQYDHESHACVP